ncbi:MAG TPA: TolC family protein [Terracidiphilus sp.]|nr:TolC family protein [Terracidiphilus sp.]
MTSTSRYSRILAATLCAQLGTIGFAQAPAQAAPPPQQQQTATPAPETPAPAAGSSAAPAPTLAQTMQQVQQPSYAQQPRFNVPLPHSHSPISPYMPNMPPPLDLANSPRLQDAIRDGKLYISLRDAIALAIENNLDLAYTRYNFPIGQMDLQRTKAGGAANGINTAIQQGSTQGGFGSASTGSAGAATGGAAAGSGGIVSSTLGQGAAVPSFDPFLNFKGFVDHTVLTEENPFQYGVAVLEQNTIQAQANYTQNFALGTGVQVNYLGQRLANNIPYDNINPALNSYLQIIFSQNLLAGFGLASNERFIHIAKKNLQINDLAFRLQVITTVTQVEDIYWDLVNAYEDVQVKERSLSFAQKTLSDDQKQLELKAIPALQVMTDQSAEATAEGDLTVSRATLRLNELQMKNAITKTDDPLIDEMPVIPLDTKGADDPNAAKPIDDLIAEAEKNRPDVAEDELAMEVEQANIKGIRSELLPSLNVYGLYEGAGIAGPLNKSCTQYLPAAECASNLPAGFGGMLENTFNYSSPEYQFGMTLQINLRNRVAKADQFRAGLEYRQKQITYEEQKKNIRFDVRNSQFALQQGQARVEAAQKAKDLAQRTFDITKQEQDLGAKSSSDTLAAQNVLALAESTLVAAQTAYEKDKAALDQSTGTTLERMGVSIDDAQSGVVTHAP